MPRKHKRRPEEPPPPMRRPQGQAPLWALAPGFDVRRVSNEKPYRCPGCELAIRSLAWHFVVVPQEDPDERRHWHEGCWRVELNRTRGKWRADDR